MARRLEPDERRAEILATAINSIARSGYRGLTLRAFARECGMTAPGVLHYFGGMPEILIAALNYRDDYDRERLADNLDRATSARELLDGVVAYNEAHPVAARFFAVVQAEAIDPAHPAHQYFVERSDQYAEEVREILRSDFDVDPGFARLLGAVLDGLQTNWLIDPERFPLSPNWHRAADLLFASKPQTHRAQGEHQSA